jgi:hypothetical protein
MDHGILIERISSELMGAKQNGFRPGMVNEETRGDDQGSQEHQEQLCLLCRVL